MRASGIAAVVVALLGSILIEPARAQYFPNQYNAPSSTANIEGITVVGKAFVTAKPNLAEFDLDVIASSEVTADAIVKYRDAKRRIRDAFTGLKLDNVGLEERGLLVDQKGMMGNPYYMFEMQGNTRNKTEVQLTRKLVVKATEIRKMDEETVLQLVAKLIDAAQDAGARVGPHQEFNPYYYNPYRMMNNAIVRFVLDDFDKLQEEAYEKAIADARTRAERLARLSRVTLGPVVAVREISVPGDHVPNPEEETPRKRLETTKFQNIFVRVELLVRFAVQAPSEGKTRNPEP
jgi:uncharacterized protein YggE